MGAVPWDKRRRCDLPLLQGGFNLEGGVKTSVNFLKITFQYLTLDIMHLGVVSLSPVEQCSPCGLRPVCVADIRHVRSRTRVLSHSRNEC